MDTLNTLVSKKLQLMMQQPHPQILGEPKHSKLPLNKKPPISTRSEIWMINRERKLRQAREIKKDKETDGCTFRPITNSDLRSRP